MGGPGVSSSGIDMSGQLGGSPLSVRFSNSIGPLTPFATSTSPVGPGGSHVMIVDITGAQTLPGGSLRLSDGTILPLPGPPAGEIVIPGDPRPDGSFGTRELLMYGVDVSGSHLSSDGRSIILSDGRTLQDVLRSPGTEWRGVGGPDPMIDAAFDDGGYLLLGFFALVGGTAAIWGVIAGGLGTIGGAAAAEAAAAGLTLPAAIPIASTIGLAGILALALIAGVIGFYLGYCGLVGVGC